jgi:23S rRNA pseudouridine1911/1915/1917 synthase
MEKMIFAVKNINGEMKISEYLKSKLGFSSSLITKVKYGGVALNGKVVTMRAAVRTGDKITVAFPEEESEHIEPLNIPLDILYEDDYMLAINKPKDMPTHPSKGNSLPTLANAVAHYMGKGFVFRAINRLDRGTSGIVIIAKDPLSAAKLGKSMKEREINKTYTAIIDGIPDLKEGRIDAPIAREKEGELNRVVREDGKQAITDYKVIDVTDDGNAVCEVKLHTGRTHQIRVHMAYIGHALVGDFLYGVENENGYSLTCSEISLPHPITNEILTIKISG